MELDWHGERASLGTLQRLESASEPREPDAIDHAAVRSHRLNRVRREMITRDIAACLLFDPVNIRYACGARNMQVFSARNPARYLFVPAQGPVILFEFAGCHHLAKRLETIEQIRPAVTASFVAAGPAIKTKERLWAASIADLMQEYCPGEQRIAVERVNAGAALQLAALGYDVIDAQEPVEMARAIKSSEELKYVTASIRATERAVGALRQALRPGITENQLWSVLHQGVIAGGGDYVETRLLSSGARTNPWFQECGERQIGEDELVALDTDVVGCHGYYCDFSRTFHSGPRRPSPRQRQLYRLAYEQITHNIALLRPGLSFRDYAERAWPIPAAYAANRYYLSAHGVGMTGEYPYLYHRMDYPESGYNGLIEAGMTLCVESYIGEEGGGDGVKLEQQVLVTESGPKILSNFPFEDSLLS